MKKMKKKKLLVGILLCAMLALNACGKNDDDAKTNPTETVKATNTPVPSNTPVPTEKLEPTNTPEPKQDDNSGTEVGIDGQTYFNSEYGFEATVPSKWSLYGYEDTLNVIYNSYSALYDNVDTMLQSFKQAGIDYPFYASALEADENGFVSNALCQVMPLSSVLAYSGGIEAYVNAIIESSVAQYKQLGAECEVFPTETKQVDGHDIYYADSVVTIDGTFAGQQLNNSTIYQRSIAFAAKDSFINIIVSYYSEDDKAYADDILNNIVFY